MFANLRVSVAEQPFEQPSRCAVRSNGYSPANCRIRVLGQHHPEGLWEAAVEGEHDLDDEEWTVIRALLPRCGPGGPDYRPIVNGILWQQQGGRRWHDLPTRYGPWHRCAERLRLWETDGTWHNVLTCLAASRPLPRTTDQTRDTPKPPLTRETIDDWNSPWLP
ncbi:transposase [Streptomyces sp. NPDC085665]|uniref:transposase n=1 Tax=Streptomyces sp. NPDC085665 TaxID=3365735 RepID=UPI0037CEB5DA